MVACSSVHSSKIQCKTLEALCFAESFRIDSTQDFHLNLIWTCFNASLCFVHSVSFWICLSVVFLKIWLFWVQMHFFGQDMWINFAECTKYFRYDPELISELWSTIFCMGKSTWIEFFDIMVACSSVASSKIQCKTLEPLCSASCLE